MLTGLLFLCIATSRSLHIQQRFIDTNETRAEECEGSLTLYEGSEEHVVNKDEDIKPSVAVEKVKVEGCGCFTLYTRKAGKGNSQFLGEEGVRMMKMRVRSVRKVECDSYL